MTALLAAAAGWQGVDTARPTASDAIFRDAANGADWPGFGRTYDEQHFSPLAQIDTGNVAKLQLAWYRDLPVAMGPVTVPLEVGGVIYMSYGLSVVMAFDVVSGRQLWRYDPGAGEKSGDGLKGAWGIRGVAWWNGKVITGTQDGRLIALDARTGRPVWSRQTTVPGDGRYITGAPRVFAGKVIIGHGGADFFPIRGYVTAYDADTGKQLWRFHTVPGNPADGFENEAMAMAAKTWTGEWWKFGGGGTVWNAITYDPEFDRIYIGTGNGQPWNRKVRSPGGGDNLFLCSVVALDAKTGKYIWHYQTNPGEAWDYNSAMDMTLATLAIDGKPRKLLLHAPKNGFLYAIDRETGKLVAADKIVPHVNWATGIDLATGRPMENPEARYPNGRTQLWPTPGGAHNWHAQAFDPRTGILYIPTNDASAIFDDSGIDLKNWQEKPHGFVNSAVSLSVPGRSDGGEGAGLTAWDVAARRKLWRIPLPGVGNAGAMATAGGLVFQGRGDGWFNAYDSRTGKTLWSYATQTGVIAAPISFSRGGRQYVTVVAGYGGIAGGAGASPADFTWDYRTQPRRLLTFALGGKARLPAARTQAVVPLREPMERIDAAAAQTGLGAYHEQCVLCHGPQAIGGGTAPDLRASPIPTDRDAFAQVVRGGGLMAAGMPKFADLPPERVEAIRQYIRQQAQK